MNADCLPPPPASLPASCEREYLSKCDDCRLWKRKTAGVCTLSKESWHIHNLNNKQIPTPCSRSMSSTSASSDDCVETDNPVLADSNEIWGNQDLVLGNLGCHTKLRTMQNTNLLSLFSCASSRITHFIDGHKSNSASSDTRCILRSEYCWMKDKSEDKYSVPSLYFNT